MNVFLVTVDTSTGVGSDWYSFDNVAIFATEELAQAFIDRQPDTQLLEIEEWAVNTELPEWDGEE